MKLAQLAPLLTPALLAHGVTVQRLAEEVANSEAFHQQVEAALPVFCKGTANLPACRGYVNEAILCLEFTKKREVFMQIEGAQKEWEHCKVVDSSLPNLSLLEEILATPGAHRRETALLQQASRTHTWARMWAARKEVRRPRRKVLLQLRESGPEDDLAQEMTHDLEMNFNKIAPFGKEDTAKELQDHAAKTQDTLVDAVENAEVAEIKRAVFRALTRLRAATIKEFDTIARLETQAIDAYNDAHHYRAENPLAHLHEDEAPVETDKLKSFH
jgi:hypothetical protein